ncbi:glycosyltransferase family protein [Kaistella palustris]|uniref:hypothetical protein n=1 Tax=Kaistella palustris TaxID=493376 RepID=UPI00040AD0A7|nr:hypothetical protein [Kaistella palustris]
MKLSFYWFLFFAGLLSIAVIPPFLPYGGIGADSISYFRQAYYLPCDVRDSLFPLGYPFALKVFHFVTDDYYWSARLVSISLYSLVGIFSWLKRFHFKETVILLSTKIFFYSFFNAISEGVFLTLMYFLFYYLYNFFEGKKRSYQFYIPAALLVTLMFSVRYSGVYLLVGMSFFYLFYYFKKRKEIHFFRNDFFKFLLLSSVGIGIYVLFNYFSFGDFAGENYRHRPYLNTIGEDFFRNIISIFNSFNPVLGLKFNGHSNFIYLAESVLFLINLFFIYFAVKIWRKHFQKEGSGFHLLLLLTGLVYTVFVFATVFFQGIEELNIRLLAESSFCYFFSLVFICYKEKVYERLIFLLAVFSLIFNSLYVIKIPENYLKRKAALEKNYPNLTGKKYFCIDDADDKRIEYYRIPLINKEVQYEHQNMQDAAVNGDIIMMRSPYILWILKDTVKNKSEVIYSSELRSKSSK